MLPYVQSREVFSCPTQPGRAFPTNWNVRGLGSIGYTTATAYDATGVEGFTTHLRLETLVSPSQSPLFADTPGGPTSEKYRGFTFDPYNGNDSAADPRLGTPLIAATDLTRGMSQLSASALKPVYARHGGRVNLIHADGHAESFTVRTIIDQTAGLQWRFRPQPRASVAGL